MSDLTLIEKSRNETVLIQVESDVGAKWVNENIAGHGYTITTVITIKADHSDVEDLIKRMKADMLDVEVI